MRVFGGASVRGSALITNFTYDILHLDVIEPDGSHILLDCEKLFLTFGLEASRYYRVHNTKCIASVVSIKQ